MATLSLDESDIRETKIGTLKGRAGLVELNIVISGEILSARSFSHFFSRQMLEKVQQAMWVAARGWLAHLLFFASPNVWIRLGLHQYTTKHTRARRGRGGIKYFFPPPTHSRMH